MHNASYGQHMARWTLMSAGAQEFEAELPHVRPFRDELLQAMEDVRAAKQRQLAARAAYQQATRDIEAAMATAHEAASRIRAGVQAMYGPASEKLVAFGIGQHNKAKITARRAVPRVIQSAMRAEGGAAPSFVREPQATEGGTLQEGGSVPPSNEEPLAHDSGSPLDGGALPQSN